MVMKVTILYNDPTEWMALYYDGKEYLGMYHFSIYRDATNREKFIRDNRGQYRNIIDCEITSISVEAIRKEVPEMFL